MRVHPHQFAPRWALAALLCVACVTVPQQAPFTAADFTVAEFNTTAARVPFPIPRAGAAGMEGREVEILVPVICRRLQCERPPNRARSVGVGMVAVGL